MLFEGKLLVTNQHKASKDTFFSNTFDISKQFRPEKTVIKK
jgi:hypothetical protein